MMITLMRTHKGEKSKASGGAVPCYPLKKVARNDLMSKQNRKTKTFAALQRRLKFPGFGTLLFVIPVILLIAISRRHVGFSLALARCLLRVVHDALPPMVGFA
jgi:hypothetical protein